MLDAAGLSYEAIAPGVDEDAAKAASNDPGEVARNLAAAKAVAVSSLRPEALVIGSDSVVVGVDGRRFDKPASREDAASHLRAFSGKVMTFTSAVALASAGSAEWVHSATASLFVRTLSEEFIASYLAAEWPEVGYCVGVFRLEGRGVQLFDRIDGDYFTILGMPLLPLLAALRAQGAIAA
jgi:septum formation protein